MGAQPSTLEITKGRRTFVQVPAPSLKHTFTYSISNCLQICMTTHLQGPGCGSKRCGRGALFSIVNVNITRFQEKRRQSNQ